MSLRGMTVLSLDKPNSMNVDLGFLLLCTYQSRLAMIITQQLVIRASLPTHCSRVHGPRTEAKSEAVDLPQEKGIARSEAWCRGARHRTSMPQIFYLPQNEGPTLACSTITQISAQSRKNQVSEYVPALHGCIVRSLVSASCASQAKVDSVDQAWPPPTAGERCSCGTCIRQAGLSQQATPGPTASL